MTITQAQRLSLYEKMKDTIGGDNAAVLMEILPPMNATDIATKQDIENAVVELRGEITGVRGEITGVRGEVAEVRAEVAEVRGEIAEVRGDIAVLRGELKASTRHALITIVAAAVTIWLTIYLPTVT